MHPLDISLEIKSVIVITVPSLLKCVTNLNKQNLPVTEFLNSSVAMMN